LNPPRKLTPTNLYFPPRKACTSTITIYMDSDEHPPAESCVLHFDQPALFQLSLGGMSSAAIAGRPVHKIQSIIEEISITPIPCPFLSPTPGNSLFWVWLGKTPPKSRTPTFYFVSILFSGKDSNRRFVLGSIRYDSRWNRGRGYLSKPSCTASAMPLLRPGCSMDEFELPS
jgi:hypothetical protein